jgi:tRNA threonylcarbamoyladenosine biosynthesis protein TsaE
MHDTVSTQTHSLANETDLHAVAARLAQVIQPGSIVFLEGQLGAGKTTFVRHFLQAVGYTGKVKSPTYAVVETYTMDDLTVHHFDWYRLLDASALEDMGFRDYVDGKAICFIEWPSHIPGFITNPDWVLSLSLIPGKPTARYLRCTPALSIGTS